MPFTFSHPAAVLPLSYLPRRWYSLTGLVVGSVVPDFEYFIRMSVRSEYSHTWQGLFYFDLPLGLALAFIFHLAARDALIENLPLFLKRYLTGYKKIDWLQTFRRQWFVIILSILFGAFTHLLWDSFTHYDTVITARLPALKHKVLILGEKMPICDILQHVSTVVGLLVILYAIRKLPADKKASSHIDYWYWLIATVITLAVAGIKLAIEVDDSTYENYIIPPISGAMIALVVTPYLMPKRKLLKSV